MLIRNLPHDSATAIAELGGESEWTLTNHLLAVIADWAALAAWQRAGNKNAKRPDPIPRPGAKPRGRTQIGRGRYTPAELRRILDEWPEEVDDGG